MQLVDAEERVKRLESCDCKKSCKKENVIRDDGEEWNIGCTTCKCHQGVIKCGPMDCGPPKCKNPQPVPGQCCPECKSKIKKNPTAFQLNHVDCVCVFGFCLEKCFINGTEYDDGETIRIGCSDCTCKDGNMACLIFCRDLKCPPDQQKKGPGDCCPYCPGDNNEYLDRLNSVKPGR